jgi:hypothetical protein
MLLRDARWADAEDEAAAEVDPVAAAAELPEDGVEVAEAREVAVEVARGDKRCAFIESINPQTISFFRISPTIFFSYCTNQTKFSCVNESIRSSCCNAQKHFVFCLMETLNLINK